jgi:hypothetical protein
VTAQAALQKLDPWAMAVQQDVPSSRIMSAARSTSSASSQGTEKKKKSESAVKIYIIYNVYRCTSKV